MKYVLDFFRNYLTIWFCLLVAWYLGELVEPGMQFADPVSPCASLAFASALIYTLARYSIEQEDK